MSAEQKHTPWRVDIKCGPEGEEAYAWVVTSDNTMIGTFKTHHAQIVARAVNSFASSQERIAQLEAALRKIDALEVLEINQFNYTHDDVCELNDNATQAALIASAALGAQPLVGWKLVPVMPTPEMLGAWYSYKSGFHFHGEPPPPDTSDYGAYRAMLAAAPERIVGAAK